MLRAAYGRWLEVNATPSGKDIKLACGVDVTERVVELLFERIED